MILLSSDEQFHDGGPSQCLLVWEDPLYETLRLEKDLEDWEVLVLEEEIMRRAEKVVGENR